MTNTLTKTTERAALHVAMTPTDTVTEEEKGRAIGQELEDATDARGRPTMRVGPDRLLATAGVAEITNTGGGGHATTNDTEGETRTAAGRGTKTPPTTEKEVASNW